MIPAIQWAAIQAAFRLHELVALTQHAGAQPADRPRRRRSHPGPVPVFREARYWCGMTASKQARTGRPAAFPAMSTRPSPGVRPVEAAATPGPRRWTSLRARGSCRVVEIRTTGVASLAPAGESSRSEEGSRPDPSRNSARGDPDLGGSGLAWVRPAQRLAPGEVAGPGRTHRRGDDSQQPRRHGSGAGQQKLGPRGPADGGQRPGPTGGRVRRAPLRCCDELLDIEYRTACRRLLARVATSKPEVFARWARPENSAAAICWIIGEVNDVFTHNGGQMFVKDLKAHFGLTQEGAPQRVSTFLRAGGFNPDQYGGMDLGSPDFLVIRRRRRAIERRDDYRSMQQS